MATAPPPVELPDRPANVREALRETFKLPKRQREVIADFLGVDPDDSALYALIALCIEHNLSPFLGHFHLLEESVRQRNAEGQLADKVRLRPAAGRDGFLAVAHQSGLFGGLQGDVVCANDTFEFDWTGRSPEEGPKVAHRHAPMSGASADDARSFRGPILGAWAISYRQDGVHPFAYYAPLREHGRVDTQGEWAGTWAYTSAMILKAAASYVLRIHYSITGVVPLDELRADPTLRDEHGRPYTSGAHHDLDTVPFGDDPEVAARLRAAVEKANEVEANAWGVARCQMTFGGRTTEELKALAESIERENVAREERDGKPMEDSPAGQVDGAEPDAT